jgi:hypothetical protein
MLNKTNLLPLGLLAALLVSGCDGGDGSLPVTDTETSAATGTGTVVSTGTGTVVSTGTGTVVSMGTGTSVATGPVSCPIPVRAGFNQPMVPHKFVRVQGVVSCTPDPATTMPGLVPSACSDPVDGFSAWGDVWFWCVKTVMLPGTTDVRAVGLVAWEIDISGIPGDVALCSASGQFVGWECVGHYNPIS